MSAGFAVCASFFFFGALIGTVSANYIPPDRVSDLRDLILDGSGVLYGCKNLFGFFLAAVPFHFAAFLLGFAVPGFLLIPLLSCLKGFFISFTAAALLRALGRGGFLIVFSGLGLPCFISLPCFFILAVQSFNASLELASGVLNRNSLRYVYDRAFFLRSAYCFAAMFLSAVIEVCVLPLFVSLMLQFH